MFVEYTLFYCIALAISNHCDNGWVMPDEFAFLRSKEACIEAAAIVRSETDLKGHETGPFQNFFHYRCLTNAESEDRSNFEIEQIFFIPE